MRPIHSNPELGQLYLFIYVTLPLPCTALAVLTRKISWNNLRWLVIMVQSSTIGCLAPFSRVYVVNNVKATIGAAITDLPVRITYIIAWCPIINSLMVSIKK